MRLDKYLVNCYIGSRKEVREMIKQKRIIVNGKVVSNNEYNILEKYDQVLLDDKPLMYKEHYYFLLNKPAGYVTSTTDDTNQTVMMLLDPLPSKLVQKLFPVGRLDKDTEGLLIITTDGKLSHFVTSPTSNIQKTYYIEFEGVLNDRASKMMKEGLVDEKGTQFKPATLYNVSETSCYLTISEGKYHQVKRMMHLVGGVVTYLKRIKIANIVLPEELKIGSYIEISQHDIYQLIHFNCKKKGF